MKRALLIIFVLAAGLLLATGTAAADDNETTAGGTPRTAYIDGGEATCTVDEELDGIRCDIKDTSADKGSIYVVYQGMDRSGRFNNTNGSGSTVTKEARGLPRGVDSSTFRWKVCHDRTFETDNCSGWVKYASGPNGSPIEIYCERSDDGGGPSSTPVCYLPDRGLNSNIVSSKCLKDVALNIGENIGVGRVIKLIAIEKARNAAEVADEVLSVKDGAELVTTCDIS